MVSLYLERVAANVRLAGETGAFLDDEAGGIERRFDVSAREDLDAVPRVHVTPHPTADRHHAAVDLRLDEAVFADDEHVVGDDATAHDAVDSERVAEAKLADELGSLVDEPVQVLGKERGT